MVPAPVRREVVREMVARGPSERRALAVGRMSASAFRYVPRPDGNAVVRDRIVDLAQRHRRYGAGMIYLKLRQAGHVINHKRVDRLYTEARLQLKRRRRKQIPRADRQPLVRPERRNQVWSADFVFDRTADGRAMKCLTIVDDATHEAVAIVSARAFGGLPVTRALDRLAITRGLPQILRTACYEQVAMTKLSRLSAPLGCPIEGQIRARARWSRPIVRHPDSYSRSGGCLADGRRAVFDSKGSGQGSRCQGTIVRAGWRTRSSATRVLLRNWLPTQQDRYWLRRVQSRVMSRVCGGRGGCVCAGARRTRPRMSARRACCM